MNLQSELRHSRRSAARLCTLCCLGLAIAGPAYADAVIDWNAEYDRASPSFGAPPQRAYLGAMVHIAIHDALNTIDPRYQRYTVVGPANPTGSPDAAIAAAAHDVLINQLSRPPETAAKATARANVEAHYAADLLAIPDGSAENLGVAAGQAAAAAIIALRLNDGSVTPNLPPYTLAAAKGVYQSTPPNLPVPAFTGWGLVTPFAMTSPSQFRPGPSPIFALKGAPYARDYNEVKQVGSVAVRGAAPNSEESQIARYWANGGANWNAVTRVVVADLGLDRWQHARLFALLEMAEADAAISTFESKYVYNFWRPVTAIRWADDGNRRTESDPAWLSYIANPPYPDYSSGLSTLAGATTEVLRRYFGTDDVSYTYPVSIPQPAPAPPEILTRSFGSLSDASAEAAESRVFAGIHFRDACVRGVRQGEKVGSYVFTRYLKPLK